MKSILKQLLFLFFSTCIYSASIHAQITLPDFDIEKVQGTVILNWINPYTSGVKSVEIQRATEEAGPFELIGKIEHLLNPEQTFMDAHPQLGNNFYRVRVVFKSNLEWLSNTLSSAADSLDKQSVRMLPSTDSLQTALNQLNGSKEDAKQIIKNTYPISKWVFTNPFTGNINIEIPEAHRHRYSLTFYSLNNVKVLEIERIRENTLILDKRNFQNMGVYKFVIKKDNQNFEEGYITIN